MIVGSASRGTLRGYVRWATPVAKAGPPEIRSICNLRSHPLFAGGGTPIEIALA